MDAGRAFNTFPLMAGRWVPEEYTAMPGWRNFFENTAAVQFDHRLLAVTTLAAVSALWLAHRRAPLPPAARALLHATAAVTACQVALGITTLLTYVPATLGSAHQSGAMALFTVLLSLVHSLRPPAPSGVARAVARGLPPAAALATLGIGVAVTQTY